MKFLKGEELIEIIERPLNANEVETIQNSLPPLDDFNKHENWLKYQISEGFQKTCIIQKDYVDHGILCYSVGHPGDKVLRVNAICSVVKEPSMSIFIAACDEIAKIEKCDSIEFTTRRSGFIKLMANTGYVPVAVVIRKKI